jgi:hypothetical protein
VLVSAVFLVDHPHMRSSLSAILVPGLPARRVWAQLAGAARAEQLVTWHHELDGPALAERLRGLQFVLDAYGPDLPAARNHYLGSAGTSRRSGGATHCQASKAGSVGNGSGEPFPGLLVEAQQGFQELVRPNHFLDACSASSPYAGSPNSAT